MRGLNRFLFVVISLVLAQLGATVYASFGAGRWKLAFFSFLNPGEVLFWFIYAALISGIALFAGWLHSFYKKPVKSFLTAWVFGTILGVVILTFVNYLIFGELSKELFPEWRFWLTRPFVIMNILISLAAALLGIWFSKKPRG